MIPRTVPIVCARSKQPRGQSIAVRVVDHYPNGERRGEIWQCACCGQRVNVVW